MSREPGQGRRDLRKYTEKGALQNSHKKKGCPLTLIVLLAVPTAAVWGGAWVAVRLTEVLRG